MQILIFGMYRSGMAPVTRLINLMGASVGPEGGLIRPELENPKGVWERQDVRELHQAVLRWGGETHNAGCAVPDPDGSVAFDPQTLDQHQLLWFKEQGRAILHNLDLQRPWVLKDPYLCFVFPLWRTLLEAPVCIHVYRHPLELARSLQAHKGLTRQFWTAVWERHSLAALANTQGLPRLLVAYQRLLEQPMETVQTLYEGLVGLGVQGLHCPSNTEIRASVEPAFAHYRGGEIPERELLNAAQMELSHAFEDCSVLEYESVPSLSAGAREILAEETVRRKTQAQLQTVRAQIEAVREAGDKEQQRLEGEVEQLQGELQTHASTLRTWEGELKELHQQLATTEWTLSETVAERTAEVESLQEQLHEQMEMMQAKTAEMAQLQAQLADTTQSFSTLKTQLERLEQQQGETQWTLVTKEQQLSVLQGQLEERAQDIERLGGWIEKLGHGTSALLSSQRWKTGCALGELRRRMLFQPRVPLASDLFEDVLRKFHAWKSRVPRRID